ncbi:MAG TPA: DNA gyrase inhibitor YacG [Bdellovibrionales bacterium]|nr:DNA gyrase inhibitor YacG [Bdellovibrionales bacterium]|tara:strand:- start:835 stop:1041 length:207 start_codon:yes stop_codon:yes gene_type:complete
MKQEKWVTCPTCKKPSLFSPENKNRPFCSERCQLLDLGQWADESFKIPAVDRDAPTVNENSPAKNEVH